MKRSERSKKTIRETEKRLFRYAILKKRVEDSRNDIAELAKRSVKCIIGNNYEGEEEFNKKLKCIENCIDADEYEIKQIERALAVVRNDYYFSIIEYKYFNAMTDVQAAQRVLCSVSTLRRQKSKLINKIADALYGMSV